MTFSDVPVNEILGVRIEIQLCSSLAEGLRNPTQEETHPVTPPGDLST